MQRYFKLASDNSSIILSWKSKGLSDERIKFPSKIINPSQNYFGAKASARFNGDCLKQEKITFNHGKIGKYYIIYEIANCKHKQLFNTRKLLIWRGQINEIC